jgi:hypothetical protein
MKKCLLFLLSAIAAGAGCAQTSAGSDRVAPVADASALEYRSAFDGYRAFTEDKVMPWREANETVKDAGDHASHGVKPEAKPTAKPQSGQEQRRYP